MTHSYDFAVLQAMPDQTRDERVNVGIVVATSAGIDVRAPELRKLRILTGHHWEEVVGAYDERLNHEWRQCRTLTGLAERIGAISEIFSLSRPGTLVVNSDKPEEYESRLSAILRAYVDRPKLSRGERQRRINYEIARSLKNAGVLYQKGQTIDDHKVVTQYVISAEKRLVADFAYKNGSMKVVSTLDLRADKAAHAQACEKGAILYFAKQKFGSTLRPYGVYAARPADAEERKSEIEILTGFADGNVFNWLDVDDRIKFSESFY